MWKLKFQLVHPNRFVSRIFYFSLFTPAEIMVIEGCANPFDGNDYYPRTGKLVLNKPVEGNDQRFVQCSDEPGVSGSTKFVGDE